METRCNINFHRAGYVFATPAYLFAPAPPRARNTFLVPWLFVSVRLCCVLRLVRLCVFLKQELATEVAQRGFDPRTFGL